MLTDGDGAGGGSSHPDVAEQKDFCFRHWQNAATSVGEGRCTQLFPGSEEEWNNSACSRNHRETVWSQTMTPYWDSPVSPLSSPIPGSEQGWLDPAMASGVRSCCSGSWPSCHSCCVPSSQKLLLDAPRLSRMCQILFAGEGAMLIVLGVALPQHCAAAEPRQLLWAPSPGARGPCLPAEGTAASQPSGPSPEICP